MGKILFAACLALLGFTACGGGGSTSSPAPVVSTRASTIPATPTPAPSPTPTAAAIAFNDYSTFGYDNGRDVYNPNSTTVTPANVSLIHLGWQASLSDFNTQTQPILATEIPGHSGLLFVGGGSGNVYAYDALTGALVWTRNLGEESYTCAGVTAPYYFGVGGTVAYDPASRSLYVMGNANTALNAPGVNTLYHLDAASGAILGQVNVAPNILGPNELNFSHTAVTLGANGLAYVGTSATCDVSSWRGRVAAISVPAMTLAQTFFTVWNGTTQPWGGGGVWGWGGVSLDPAGNVFTGVGNTDNGTTSHGTIAAPFAASPAEDSGNGEAFVELSPALALEAAQHPIAQTEYGSNSEAADLDLNGTPVVLNPTGTGCDTIAALQSKAGVLYIYDTTKIANGPIAQYQLAPPSYEDPFIGDPAYSPATGLIYEPVPVGTGSLYPPGMIAINPGCGAPSVTWHTSFGPDSALYGNNDSRSVPAVSAGGVVFVGTPCEPTATGGCTGSIAVATAAAHTSIAQGIRKPAICCAPPSSSVGGAVWALDASTGAVLNGGNPLITTGDVIRVPPTIDGKWIFVIDNSGDVYGLTIDPNVPVAAAKYRAPDARARRPWEARPTVGAAGN